MTVAELCFEDLGGRRYEVEIKPPFGEAEEAELEWYFEQYLRFPFVENVRYEQAGASVREYGVALFFRSQSAEAIKELQFCRILQRKINNLRA